MPGVSYGKNRKAPPAEIDLLSPTGARITVSAERAKILLGRQPLTLPDGSASAYRIDEGDEPEIEPAAASGGRSERV